MRALVFICALATAAHADDVHVGFGLTGSSVAVSDRNGTGMVTEIKKMVTDQVAVGGRVEVAVMFGGVVDETELSVAMAASGLAKGEVFLLPGQVRPFVGFGIGGYTVGAQTAFMSRTGRYFGFAPQVGIELGRVRFAATYNEIIGTKRDDYLSLELAFEFAR